MKVKVYVKCEKPTQTEEYLHDILTDTQEELAMAYAKCDELTAQINTLNTALEASYAHQEKTFQEKRDVERDLEIMGRDFKHLKSKFADACAERDNLTASYKQLVHQYGELQAQATDECSDLREELHDRNARIDELEKKIKWLEDERALYNSNVKLLEQKLKDADEELYDARADITKMCNAVEHFFEEWQMARN